MTETGTFYDLWQAFVTIKGMCVRYGKAGQMSGLGSQGKMTMGVFSHGVESSTPNVDSQ